MSIQQSSDLSMSVRNYVKGLKETGPKTRAAPGLVPIPANQTTKRYNSWDVWETLKCAVH